MNLHKQTGWQVGNEFFHNKWDAIQYATNNPQYGYKAFCNDDTWNNADWTREPTESIEQLQKNHAEYLREKYKTLVLFYSGGVDSATVLDVFIKNKIPLDYIHVMYVEDPDIEFNIDTRLAMQYLKDNESKLMGAEILYEKRLDNYEGNSIYTFNKQLRDICFKLTVYHTGHPRSLEVRQPKIYQKVVEDGCIISGGNKPYVYKDDNGYYMQYVDHDDENWGQPHLEMFYVGQDPTLQIKQCHIAKNWLEQHNLNSTNAIYKSNNINTGLSLNKSFGRIFIDEYFYIKRCFGHYIDDEHFRQHYHPKWHTVHWVNHFNKWKNTKSYYNLIAELDKVDDKFVKNSHCFGWLTEKRYLD